MAFYGRRVTGSGTLYGEKQRSWTQCKKCGEEKALGLLVGHMQTHHGRAAEGRRHWEATVDGKKPQTYRMVFLTAGQLRNCPVEGFPGQVLTRMAMRVNFFYCDVKDTIIILEEGNLPHPQCSRWDMLVPWRAMNRRHIATSQCTKWVGN